MVAPRSAVRSVSDAPFHNGRVQALQFADGLGSCAIDDVIGLIVSWVQRLNGVSRAAGSTVTLNTTAPTSNQ
jgi:hypothetical protein